MVIVSGNRDDLRVRDSNLRVERGEFQMLPMLLGAIVAARQSEDERVIALQRAEIAQGARVIGQFVVRENASGHDIRTHDWTPPVSLKDLLLKDLLLKIVSQRSR